MSSPKKENVKENVPEEEAEDVLKKMVSVLQDLPTETLQQLNKNLDAIEDYNRKHPESVLCRNEEEDESDDD